ncbi:MAG: proton-conducting membrane transporter [Lachnospiraceae bacterium]|nr:proton-conducting membrane transporter [Lachnospiraceae bacterium]
MHPVFLLISILLPLAGGFLILPLKFTQDRRRNIYCEIIACLTTVLVWMMILAGSRDPFTIYSFTDGFSITFRLDGMAMLFAGMVSVMWPLVLLYAFSYMEHASRKNPFFAFYVMTYGIALGIAFSADMITMYVFFEMLTLVTIPLVSHYGDHESLYAGRLYAAYTIGGASLAFFAVILTTIYGNAGTFIYGGSLTGGYDFRMLEIAFIFGFFGFGTKAAVFPLFRWLPTASAAPTPVTALLHAVAVVNAGVFAVMRMVYYVYGAEILKGTYVQTFCLVTAAFSLLFGAVMAVKERHFKRRLAYSTMSNLSYMLFGIMLMTPAGFAAGMAHMLFHGIIKITLFMCAGAFMHKTGNSYIFEINGVGRKMPVTFTCYTLGALSLTGIPLFCGFISKWQLLMAGAQEGSKAAIIGVVSLIVSAFLCAIYTLSVSIRAFFPISGKDRYLENKENLEADRLMLIPIAVFSIANIYFGVQTEAVLSFLNKIAAGLL